MKALCPSNKALQSKYAWTAWWYDILDYPWERQYRQWRPKLLSDLKGDVLEAGIGTGRNLRYYPADVHLTGIELSSAMLSKAKKRAKEIHCYVTLVQDDATAMSSIPSNHFDWIISTFMCCVMPDALQPLAVAQFERVLKPGGRFRLLEMVYSRNKKLNRKQRLFAPLVEKVYGARFDRKTLDYLNRSSVLQVEKTYFLKADTYLVIEGLKKI